MAVRCGAYAEKSEKYAPQVVRNELKRRKSGAYTEKYEKYAPQVVRNELKRSFLYTLKSKGN